MSYNGQFGDYNIDICLCIDKTGSMSPIINTVKANALNLYSDITEALREKGKYVNQLRIRIVWFGDYVADGENAMIVSDFLTMPDEMDKFREGVECITAYGGGDTPEDGLEALAIAMRSPWNREGWKRRHIIAVFTDAPAHDLGHSAKSPSYPKSNMPATFGELSAMWGDEDDESAEMDFQAKRLLLFAPNDSYWKTISNAWENTVIRNAKEATGLAEVTYRAMLDTIVNSVG